MGGEGGREWSLREEEESEITEGKDLGQERWERRESWRKGDCARETKEIGRRETGEKGRDSWEKNRSKGR